MKVVSEQSREIPVSEMKNGEIGVITSFPELPECKGWVMQMTRLGLMCLGSHFNETVSNKGFDTATVRILPKGTLLEI